MLDKEKSNEIIDLSKDKANVLIMIGPSGVGKVKSFILTINY